MKKNPWAVIGLMLALFIGGGLLFVGGSCVKLLRPVETKITRPSILHLELEGVIIDGKKFLKKLRKYREEEDVKVVLISINSPGGVVGPSQEIWREIQRTREEFKKPVVVVSSSLLASGAYYAAVAADKVVVAPGTLMGSIGVIMEFANLKELYSWAKIERYVLKTGPYKDTGAEYRPMSADEKKLMQEMLDEVYGQFKKAVADGRKLKPEVVDAFADGRIFTGATGVKNGFADSIGTYDDAVKVASEIGGLGDDPEIVEPPREKPNFFEFLREDDEESEYSKFEQTARSLLNLRLTGVPLFLMPGTALK